MNSKNKSRELPVNSGERARSVLEHRSVPRSKSAWKLVGVIALFFAVLLGFALYVGPNVSSSQRSTAAAAEPAVGTPKKYVQSTVQANDTFVASRGTVTITNTTETPGGMEGTFDCTIRVNIDAGGGQVSTTDIPRVYWKDDEGDAIWDDALWQVGTTSVWEWSGTLMDNPASAEVIVFFVTSKSAEAAVPYKRTNRRDQLEIKSLKPKKGKVGKIYENMEITGQNFGKGTDGAYVTIGTFRAAVKSWEDETIVVSTTPAMTASEGEKQVVVHNESHQQDEKKWIVTE